MTKLPWEKKEDETSKSYHAFCLYRDMGPERTHDRVRQRLERPKGYLGYIQKWSAKYDWVKRAEAYDEHLERMQMAHMAELRRRRNEETLKTCEKFHSAVRKRLEAMLENEGWDLTPSDMIRWFKEAVELELKVRGDPTEYVKMETMNGGPVEEDDPDRIKKIVDILDETGIFEEVRRSSE